MLPTASCSPAGLDCERQHHGLRVEPQRLGVGEAARVGRGQAQLEVRRVLVVRRGERAARHAGERLDRVLWQFDGQWCMTSAQVSAAAGSVPSCGSVAEPEKAIESPTFQVVRRRVSIVADGGGCRR